MNARLPIAISASMLCVCVHTYLRHGFVIVTIVSWCTVLSALESSEEIFASMQRAESSRATIQVTWSQKVRWHKDPGAETMRKLGMKVPSSEGKTLKAELRLLAVGNDVRFDQNGFFAGGVEGQDELGPTTRVDVLSGPHQYFFYDNTKRPFGVIDKPKAQILGHITVSPIRYIVRPYTTATSDGLTRGHNASVDRVSLDNEQLSRMVGPPSPELNRSVELFYTNSSPYSLRYVNVYSGKTRRASYRLHYLGSRDDDFPSGWTGEYFSDDGITKVCDFECVLSQVDIALKISESELRPSFPLNAWVTDKIAREQYIQLANGQRRTITKEELKCAPRYEDLLRTSSGDACNARSVPSTYFVMFLIVNVAIVVTVIAYRWFRNMNRVPVQRHL